MPDPLLAQGQRISLDSVNDQRESGADIVQGAPALRVTNAAAEGTGAGFCPLKLATAVKVFMSVSSLSSSQQMDGLHHLLQHGVEQRARLLRVAVGEQLHHK
jgi:hypothetical protein